MQTLEKNQAIFTKHVGQLIQYIFAQGYECTLGEAFRTQEQAEIYAKNGKGIKNSLHCDRLAIDINLFSPEGKYLTDTKAYAEIGGYWKSLSGTNRWGGDFSRPDGNHFERVRSR